MKSKEMYKSQTEKAQDATFRLKRRNLQGFCDVISVWHFFSAMSWVPHLQTCMAAELSYCISPTHDVPLIYWNDFFFFLSLVNSYAATMSSKKSSLLHSSPTLRLHLNFFSVSTAIHAYLCYDVHWIVTDVIDGFLNCFSHYIRSL